MIKLEPFPWRKINENESSTFGTFSQPARLRIEAIGGEIMDIPGACGMSISIPTHHMEEFVKTVGGRVFLATETIPDDTVYGDVFTAEAVEKIASTVLNGGWVFGSADLVGNLIKDHLREIISIGDWCLAYDNVFKHEGKYQGPATAWQSEEYTTAYVTDDTVSFGVGCGSHHIKFVFNHQGDLLEINPDDYPSENCWENLTTVEERRQAVIQHMKILDAK